MAGAIIALSLFGLGAVQALPTASTLETRQVFIGDGSGVFVPLPDENLPPCLVGGSEAPQAPCFLPPIPGDIQLPPGLGYLPKDKRDAEEAVAKRQFWIGDGTVGLWPGNNAPKKPCLVGIPLKNQPPCLLGPTKQKRGLETRQTLIIGGGGALPPGLVGGGGLPVCLPSVPLVQQPPCFLPPISGGGIILPPKEKREAEESRFVLPPDAASAPKKYIEKLELELIALQNKPHKSKYDLQKIKDIKAALLYLIGLTDIQAPPGSGSTFTPGKRQFKLPPDAVSNPKKYIEQFELELIALQNKKYKTRSDLQKIKDIKAALLYLVGITNISAPPGTGSTFTPGKRDPAFKLPPDAATNPKRVLVELETRLIALQNKPHKTDEDREDIALIKAAILYVAGITNISAPPGTGSTFTPGKRDPAFKLPPDAATNPKRVLVELETRLIALQNKPHKTDEDREDIALIKAAILYVAGITNISAPPGTGSTFTPGKRDPAFKLPPDAATNPKRVLVELEARLIALQNKADKTDEDREDIELIKAALLYVAGITNISAPPGTGSTFTPGKRDVVLTPEFDLQGLVNSYNNLVLSIQGSSGETSATTYLVLSQIADTLALFGYKVDRITPTLVALHPKRQTNIITIGRSTCRGSDISGLKSALEALLSAYGDPSKAPKTIWFIQQVLVTALQLCGQGVEGWTTIIPAKPIPGGPIVPQPITPGAPIKPDPYVPGNPIKPSD